ncbi:MAG: tetratricopeptide repeat protein, partial [Flavobacteriales bacterium]
MARYIFLSLLFIVFASRQANSQVSDEQIMNASKYDKFEAASTLMENKQYFQAMRLWASLLKDEPDNANFNYLAGQCQLEIQENRKKSIDYLNKTIGKTVKNYAPDDADETGVPVDALFYLGRAYHLAGQFDKSIETFEMFRKEANKKHILQAQVDHNIAYVN